MSKDTKEKDDESNLSNTNWSYDGNEDNWNAFDRRMQRYMRKKLGVFGENLWLGAVPDFAGLVPLYHLNTTNTATKCGWRSTALTQCKRGNSGTRYQASGPMPISECGLKGS